MALAEFLPLRDENWITWGNALRLDWFSICPRHLARDLMQYDLGWFDDETCRLGPIENPFGPKVLPMSPEWTLVRKCLPSSTGLSKQLSGTFKSIHQQSSTRPWRCLVGCPEFAAAYTVGRGNRTSLPFFGGEANALVHTDLPPRLRLLAAEASNAGIVTTLSEGDFDWDAFRGEPAEIPRYVVVVTLPTVADETRSAVAEPLLLPETTGNPAGVPNATRDASKLFKKIRT